MDRDRASGAGAGRRNGLVFLREAGKLRALHASDGSGAWNVRSPTNWPSNRSRDNGWLVVALFSGEVRALRATDGEVIWNRDLKSRAHAAPALAADRVYIPTADGRIVALRVDERRTALGAPSRRRTQRDPRARRAAVSRSHRTTGSTA